MTNTRSFIRSSGPRRRYTAPALCVAVWMMALGLAGAAHADTGGYPYASMPCEHAPYADTGARDYCANYDWGAKHTTRYNDASEISPYGYAYRNCTDFVAWKLASLGVPANLYRGHGNASGWASVPGLITNTTPAVGAVAVQTSGTYGHVAFIIAVSGPTIKVAEYNYHENGTYDTRTGTLGGLGFNRVTHFERYERSAPAAAPSPAPGPAPSPISSPAPGSSPAPSSSPSPTYAETTGSVAHTWTDYADAGGTQGPEIGSNQTVQIACWVSGFHGR